MKHGRELPIKAPASRTIGYDSDSVSAKVLRIPANESKDKREHGFYVVYDATKKKGVLKPREMVIGSILVSGKGSEREIQSFRIRMKLDGTIISGMKADGIVTRVKQRPLAADSSEIPPLLAAEKNIFLNDTPLSRLKK